VDLVPPVARVPVQPPDAVHDVALVEDQVNVELAPLATVAGLKLSDTVGGVADTVTVADWDADPPAPVQVMTNVVVAVRAAVLVEPLVASDPLQPPEAVQAAAFVDVHVSTEVAPLPTVLGLALKVTEGAGVVTDTVTDWFALPPEPVQLRL
jgi:hypothetical protein